MPGRLCLSTLCLALLASPSLAKPPTAVYPTGNATTDRLNVQAAVALGGNVLLKATNADGVPTPFEFGASAVLLTANVTVVGETVGSNMTTIHGGFLPFRPSFFPRVTSAIRGIHFHEPLSGAVLVTASTGFEFTNNVVTDVIGTPWFGMTKGQSVWVTDNGLRGAIIGTIVIENNVVERVHADLSYGVALASFDAAARIAGNSFVDTKDTGILVVRQSQPVSIEDNLIAGGSPFAGFDSAGNGIFTGQGSGPVYIRRNTVTCDNPFADGIALSGHTAAPGFVPTSYVVEDNVVTMRGSLFGAITTYGQVGPTLIANNRLSGDGAFALSLVPYFGGESTTATFRGNNISAFRSSVADVFFDTTSYDSVLVGNSGTVIDNGTGSRITGFTVLQHGVGPQIAAAQERKRQLLQTLEAVGVAGDPN